MNERMPATPETPVSNCVVVSNVDELATPVKRMLRMQFKEFVHHIEDAEEGFGVNDQLIRATDLQQRVA